MRVDIKPLSVNKAWRGRRFKTPEYNRYERGLKLLLPNIKVSDKPLVLTITFYFSSKASDIDNCVKLIVDVMQKKYGFNDNKVYEMHLYKKLVKKGSECFEFSIDYL